MKINLCLIEDDNIQQFVVSKMVEKYAIADDIIPFYNGEEAIAYFKKIAKSNKLPDVIFLDINMPIMDGWEFLTEFEKIKDQFNKEIPVFMLTSSLNTSDESKAQTFESVKGYITKPCKGENIKNLVDLIVH